MELPQRKHPRLKDYDYSQNGYYFVTICTYNRERIFGEIVGATLRGRPNRPDKIIEKYLFELENKYQNVKLDYYVIMPDHIHMILFISGDHAGSPLPQIIDWFKTMTTNEYIKGVKTGLYPPFQKHIWQRSFYEHVIRNENDLYETRKYIENNPLKWEMTKRKEDY